MKLLALMTILISPALHAAVAPFLMDGVALQGYDAVSYFEESKPEKGSPDFICQADGATYRFSSRKHLELFKSHPKNYEPAYGGWCAYAMSRGEEVEVNPERFKIVGGRLLLFYDAYWNDTLKKWNLDEAKLLTAADEHWKQLNASPPSH